MDLVTVFDNAGACLNHAQLDQCFAHYLRFLALTQEFQMPMPKRHQLLHLLRQASWFGNPRYHANWRDEALNKVFKRACVGVSQATFEATVLCAMEDLMALGVGR